MKIDEGGVVESNSANYSGLEYVDLSREFIKILDGKWTRLRNICYMFVYEKGNIG